MFVIWSLADGDIYTFYKCSEDREKLLDWLDNHLRTKYKYKTTKPLDKDELVCGGETVYINDWIHLEDVELL